eukprot:5784731-Alexandrium_andersonii.AAC.1
MHGARGREIAKSPSFVPQSSNPPVCAILGSFAAPESPVFWRVSEPLGLVRARLACNLGLQGLPRLVRACQVSPGLEGACEAMGCPHIC